MTVLKTDLKCEVDIEEEGLEKKRLELLLRVWELLTSKRFIDEEKFSISKPLLNEVVLHYLDDVRILKCRYKIQKGKIQLHKIAGLMTSLILRYRPIVPHVEEFESESESYINELFAIIHGLAICGEYSLEVCEQVAGEEWFSRWLNDFLYILHIRHHTPEMLVFIFQTLSIFIFQKNFETIDL